MAVKSAGRRKLLRQQRAGTSVSWWARLRERFGLMPFLAAVVFFVFATAISLFGPHARRYAVGQKIDQPIYAEVNFELLDEQQTLRMKQAARAATPSHYRLNQNLILRIASDLQNLYQAAQANESFDAFSKVASKNKWRVDTGVYDELRSYAQDPERFGRNINRLKQFLAMEYTWDPTSVKARTPQPTAEVVVVHSTEPGQDSLAAPREVSVFKLTPISNDTGLKRGADDLVDDSGFAQTLRPLIADILVRHMSAAPTLVFDVALTNDAMAQREANVAPVTIQYVAGQPLVSIRNREGLTPGDLQLLAQHDDAVGRYLSSAAEGAEALRERKRLRQLGLATVFVLLTAGLFFYVGMYQPRVFQVPARTVALVVLILGTLLVCRLFESRSPVTELVYAPVLFAASVLAVAYSRRFAVGVMTVTATIIVLSTRGDAAMLVTMIVGLAATVHMLKEIRTRTQLLWVGALSAGTIFITSMAFGLIDGQAVRFAGMRATWAAGGALASALLIQATLPLIERVFRIATPLTLMEWRDTTRPLLQRLAQEAPGTYAHSLALGTLGEAACSAIGANGLLTQVGALYHDIGKLHKVEYFAENQEASINRHDNLAPTMSLLIIIGHVKDGVEIAKEYKIPRVLFPFIQEHHGTTVVRYFHAIASEKQPQIAKGKHDREVPEAQFRYPGPKPRTKETAILMLCDGVEGAVRALSEPTPGRIETVVHQLVTDRLNDGQFDDCEITLRELHRVEESLVKSLCSLYHGRVAYPKSRDKAEREGEKEGERASIAG